MNTVPFNKIAIISLAIIFTFISKSFGQDLGLNLMTGLPNSIINPAFDSEDKILVGIGSLKYSLSNETFTLGQAFDDGPNGKVLNLSNVASSVNERNLARYNESISTLEVGYNFGKIILYGGHKWKLDANLFYSKDLVNLIAYGNEPFIGQSIQIGPNITYTSYNETYVGFSGGNEKLRFGLRAKLLNGVQNLATGNSKLKLTTSDDIYQLELDSDYEFYSSEVLTYNSVDDYDFNTKRFSTNHYFSANWGYGIDLGLSTKLQNFEVFMSGVDLGSIKWKENAKRYYNKSTITFEGLDLVDFIDKDPDFSIEDSIKSLINLNEENQEYSTSLSGKIYIGGKYKIDDKYQVGAVMSREVLPIDNAYALMINGQRTLGKYFKLGLSITYRDRSITNLGGHIIADFSPVTLYATAHNVLAALFPENFNSISIRFGGTLGFGNLNTL